MMLEAETIAQGVAGLGGLTLAGRWFFSWWGKQGHADRLDERQSTFVQQLQKEHESNLKSIEEVRAQNKLLEKQNAELHAQTIVMRAQAQMMYRMLEANGTPPEHLKIFAWLMEDDNGQA